MSCTVFALPIMLAQAIGAVIAAGAVVTANKEFEDEPIEQENFETGEFCEEVEVITAKHFMEKEFETVFMDKDLLIKTLGEHGVLNIKENEWGKISGQVESYTLTFEKPAEDKPYQLQITCLDTDNAEEKLDDLSSEYALNVQEETYLSIIDKLKNHNMELENEEVLDDNTIVLTVNLE